MIDELGAGKDTPHARAGAAVRPKGGGGINR